jgi:hypothetical protein
MASFVRFRIVRGPWSSLRRRSRSTAVRPPTCCSQATRPYWTTQARDRAQFGTAHQLQHEHELVGKLQTVRHGGKLGLPLENATKETQSLLWAVHRNRCQHLLGTGWPLTGQPPAGPAFDHSTCEISLAAVIRTSVHVVPRPTAQG